METIILTAVATILSKPFEKITENVGDVIWKQGEKLITQLRQKQKAPTLTASIEANEPLRLDYGQAVLELTAAAEQDPEIAQAVRDVEAAVNNDESDAAKEIKKLVQEIKSHPSVVNNFAKLAEEIKAEKGSMVAQKIEIGTQNNTYT